MILGYSKQTNYIVVQLVMLTCAYLLFKKNPHTIKHAIDMWHQNTSQAKSTNFSLGVQLKCCDVRAEQIDDAEVTCIKIYHICLASHQCRCDNTRAPGTQISGNLSRGIGHLRQPFLHKWRSATANQPFSKQLPVLKSFHPVGQLCLCLWFPSGCQL